MTPTPRAALHARLDVLETKAQYIGWQITAHDCDVTLARIRGGLLSRAAVESELLRLRHALARSRFEIALAKLRIKANFNPAQPRVPRGKPGGGQWTREGGLLSTDLSAVRKKPPGALRPSRLGFHNLNPTLDQQVRYAEATTRADEALAQVRRYDPNWQPTVGVYDLTNPESHIRRLDKETEEAEKHLLERLRSAPGQGSSQAPGGGELTEDVLAPGGRPIGLRARGANDRVRTVSSREFYDTVDRLTKGSWPTAEPADYEGLRYERVDGTLIGLRFSEQNGITIDVLKSEGPVARQGFRVHRR